MRVARTPLSRFVLHVILWLPICFAAWYFSSILRTLPVAQGASLIGTWLFSELIEGLYQRGNLPQVVSAFSVPMPEQGPGAIGELLAIACQFGYLILPPVAPIVLWVGQFQTQLLELNAAPEASARP